MINTTLNCNNKTEMNIFRKEFKYLLIITTTTINLITNKVLSTSPFAIAL